LNPKIGTPTGWGFENRASNAVSIKYLTAIETSTITVGKKRNKKCNVIRDNI
jgi:hypothetical protein